MCFQPRCQFRPRRSEEALLAPQLPYDDMDMHSLIQAQAVRHDERTFLIWEPFHGAARTWTYVMFLGSVRDFAAGLHERGDVTGQCEGSQAPLGEEKYFIRNVSPYEFSIVDGKCPRQLV